MSEHAKDPNHHFHAVTANNRAWDLAVMKRNMEQDEEMLTIAHASAYHRQALGIQLNQMRATMLLAEVHSLLNLGKSAWNYAEKMKAFFLGEPTIPGWELAFTHTIHAHAAATAGKADAHRKSYSLAEEAITGIEDKAEREIVLATFRQVPVPMRK